MTLLSSAPSNDLVDYTFFLFILPPISVILIAISTLERLDDYYLSISAELDELY